MQVFRQLPPLAERTPCALTIGNFDGVHRGHQAVIGQLAERAGHPLDLTRLSPTTWLPASEAAHLGRYDAMAAAIRAALA